MSLTSRSPRIPSSLATSFERSIALRRGRAQWSVVVITAAGLLMLPLMLPVFWLHLLNNCLIAIVGAVALNLLSGNARLVSLGQAAFMGIGAFAAGLLDRALEVNIVVALAAASLAGALTGVLVGLLSLRLRALYVAVTTLVLHVAAVTLFSIVQAMFLGSSGMILPVPAIFAFELTTPFRWYFVLLSVATLTVLGALNLLRSYAGRRWIAVGEHDVAAEALGVSVLRAKLSVFALSSAVVAFSGALSAYYAGTVSFESYNLNLAIMYLAMIIVGGTGSVLGSVLGAIVITLLPYLLDQMFALLNLRLAPNMLAGVHQVAFGALIVLFLLFEPRGLAEMWRRTRASVAGWPFGYRAAQRGA